MQRLLLVVFDTLIQSLFKENPMNVKMWSNDSGELKEITYESLFLDSNSSLVLYIAIIERVERNTRLCRSQRFEEDEDLTCDE
jgi:hypothetical protein